MTRPGRCRGFSLIEVLVSLALGSLVLGVVLSDISSHVVRLARVEPEYRAMLVADAVLEKAAAEHSTSSQTGNEGDFAYTVVSGPVQADSRVMELKATVPYGNGRQVSLSIYRLRSSMGSAEGGSDS